MKKARLSKKLMSMILCMAMLFGCVPASMLEVTAAQQSGITPKTEVGAVADPGSAYTWEKMLGTEADGNRYAGRVWVDKSVYKEEDIAVLNTRNEEGSSFKVDLKDGEDFQVIFSALGSSMTTTEKTTTAGALDVVMVLDNSDSMKTNDRMGKLITAANNMLAELLKEGNDVRIGIVAYSKNAQTVLNLDTYTQGVKLQIDRNGVMTALNKNNQRIDSKLQSDSYELNTNIQAGFNLGMDMLSGAQNKEGRKPVVILMTDGAANTAVTKSFYDISKAGNAIQIYYSNTISPGIAMSTLLSNAYKKACVEDQYGMAPKVFGIGVDLSNSDGSNAIMNPKDNFNANNSNSNIKEAYGLYLNWKNGNNITKKYDRYDFTFDHNYPQGSTVTDVDVIANINYVDNYQNVSHAGIGNAFETIYKELTSAAFNPISSSTTTPGVVGAQNKPLIYVDFIGQHMEVKDIQAVTLFGSSYGVVNNGNGSYSVQSASGVNPTTKENWNTASDIRISVSKDNGVQKLQIEIDQEILPIILEQVSAETIGEITTATIAELMQEPLRVYYTVGLSKDVLLPNGDLDVSKLQGYPNNGNGTVTFYSNQFGVMNQAVEGTVHNGDAHVGFKPSAANRYYYYQSNQRVFSNVTRKDGKDIAWDRNELYGVLYEDGKYNLTDLTYQDYRTFADDKEVYMYVNFYRPTASQSDAATTAEKVSYLVYTSWKDLKESVAFYDATTKKYINYDDANTYVTADKGFAAPEDKVDTMIAAYMQDHPNAQIYGVLGVNALRTSRFHNMTKAKKQNPTNTAALSYVPEYTYETSASHNGNDVVVWLGNNGKLTKKIDTGIKLTKAVTEPIGNVNDTYALTVTLKDINETVTPIVKDSNGNDVTQSLSTYAGNVLTVNLKAGETVYITGIPAGTVCEVGESIPTNKAGDYFVSSKTGTVTIPTVAQVLNGTNQFVEATVTNAPLKYGDLTIVKDIQHNLTTTPADMSNKVFTFEVTLPIALAGKTYSVDKENASLFTADAITVGTDGKFTVQLKDNESISIIGIPAGTTYTATETSVDTGYVNKTGSLTGSIVAGEDAHAHFINEYTTTKIKPNVTITGKKTVASTDSSYSGNEDFIVELSQYVGASSANTSEYKVLGNVTVKNGGTYTFNLTNLLQEALDLGEYYFKVSENPGTTTGMLYDTTEGLFKVVITDTNADGTLEYTVENVANTTVDKTNTITVTKDFNNTYDVAKTYADIHIIKNLENITGVDISKNIFEFELTNVTNSAQQEVVETIHTNASGNATIRISDLDVGTYKYKLQEKTGNLTGMTYDTAPRFITVVVTKNGNELNAVATVDGATTQNTDNSVDISFNNTYQLQPTTHTISGTKELTGRTINNDEFSFALYETDSSFDISGKTAKETVTNTGNTFSFRPINYSRVGTYYYSVKEVAGTIAGMTYDTVHYHVTVTVGIDSTDATKLAVKDVSINKIGHNADESGDVVFVNTYTTTPTEYTLGGKKILNGRAMKAEEFEFGLYREGEDTPIETVKNNVDGTFTFNKIIYTSPGTYVYTIKEILGNVPGVIYTKNPVGVTVTVEDTNAVLSATADLTNAQIQFTNTYTPAPVGVSFKANKTLRGDFTDSIEAFTFMLYETDNSFVTASDGLIDTKSVKSGEVAFKSLTYSKTGTYYYTIVEDTSTQAEGIVYDQTQHNYVVTVTDDGNDALKASIHHVNTGNIIASVAGTVNVDAAQFTNATFEEAAKKEVFVNDTTVNIDGTEVNAGDILTYKITYTNYTGKNVEVDINDTIPQHTTYVDGSVSHNGTYVGEHINWIIEVPKGESIEVSFKVKVDEVGGGKLTNQAIIEDGINTYTTNEVENVKYDNVKITVNIVKNLKTTGDINHTLGGFEFQLKDVTDSSNIKKLPKVTSDNNGHTSYTLTFTKDDSGKVYKYELSEINSHKKDMSYDTTVHKLEIAVEKDIETGELILKITQNGKVVDEVEAHFNNTYSGKKTKPDKKDDPGKDVEFYPYTGSTTTDSTTVGSTGVNTGDNANIGLFILLIGAAIFGFAGIVFYKRKKH